MWKNQKAKVEQLKVRLGLGRPCRPMQEIRKKERQRNPSTILVSLARRKSQPQHPFSLLLCSLHRDVWNRHAGPRCLPEPGSVSFISTCPRWTDKSKIKSDLISRVATSSSSIVYLNFCPQLIYQPLPAPCQYHQRPADIQSSLTVKRVSSQSPTAWLATF